MSAPLNILTEILGSRDLASVALKALNTAGYVCVPRVATPKMLADGWAAAHDEDAADTWRDMVNSALATEAEETPEE